MGGGVMTTTHNYQILHDEMAGVADRYLALAELIAEAAPIDAHNLRIMAALARKIVKSTEQRMRDLAAASGEGRAND
jgi:hypothetical protein